jgi:hypothetical protein
LRAGEGVGVRAGGTENTAKALMVQQTCFVQNSRLERNVIAIKNVPANILIIIIRKTGGRGGIRTHGRVAPTPDFESGAFNHSATLPAVY